MTYILEQQYPDENNPLLTKIGKAFPVYHGSDGRFFQFCEDDKVFIMWYPPKDKKCFEMIVGGLDRPIVIEGNDELIRCILAYASVTTIMRLTAILQ